MLIVVYALIGLVCLLNLWLYKALGRSQKRKTSTIHPALARSMLLLPILGGGFIMAIMISLREYQYLPGLILLIGSFVLLMTRALRTR